MRIWQKLPVVLIALCASCGPAISPSWAADEPAVFKTIRPYTTVPNTTLKPLPDAGQPVVVEGGLLFGGLELDKLLQYGRACAALLPVAEQMQGSLLGCIDEQKELIYAGKHLEKAVELLALEQAGYEQEVSDLKGRVWWQRGMIFLLSAVLLAQAVP